MFRFRNGIQNMTVCIIQYLEIDVPRTPACQCFFKKFFQEKGFFLSFFFKIYLFDRQRSQVVREAGRKSERKKQAPR